VVAALARIDPAVAAGRGADARRAGARPARLDAARARAAVAAGDATVVAAFLRLHDAVAALRAAAPVRGVAVVVLVAVAREPVDVVRDPAERAARARDHGIDERRGGAGADRGERRREVHARAALRDRGRELPRAEPRDASARIERIRFAGREAARF